MTTTTKTHCNTDPECPPEIAEALTTIEAAAGPARCTDANPCGLVAYYDGGEERPWRIADDWVSLRFATADEAAEEAATWGDE